MTLAAILAAHTAKLAESATPPSEGVARCGAESVGAQRVTHATPATPKRDSLDPLALHAIRALLQTRAAMLGIPRSVVDNLPVEELAAAAEQMALSEGHLDGRGDPLPQALLVFYLRELAARIQE